MSKTKAVERKTCFVICPIGSEGDEARIRSDWLLDYIIRPVLESEEFGFEVIRADQIPDAGIITTQVIELCHSADLIVADLTDHNPNVFYELAIAHSTKRPVIPMILQGQKLPFDNSHVRTNEYNIKTTGDIKLSKERLVDSAHRVLAENYKVSNPITAALGEINIRDKADPKDQLVLDALGEVKHLSRKVELLKAIQETIQSDLDYMVRDRSGISVSKKRGVIINPQIAGNSSVPISFQAGRDFTSINSNDSAELLGLSNNNPFMLNKNDT